MRYLLLLLLSLAAGGAAGEAPLRVAVAANFRATLEQATALFERRTGHRVVLSSGSTGVLTTQILQGAPFDLFFAADREAPWQLAQPPRRDGIGEPFCYARGVLVLAGGDGALAALADPGNSLAIANPATAPYGRAAMAVLARPEFAAGAARRLVRGTNVLQAFQFWHSGAARLALLPLSLAPAGTPVPADWYPPLEQFAVALTPLHDHPVLADYLAWMRSDTVRSLILDAGYRPCP